MKRAFGNPNQLAFLKNLKKFNFLVRFDALISKIIFKKLKNIILIYFNIKNILKSNGNHTPE